MHETLTRTLFAAAIASLSDIADAQADTAAPAEAGAAGAAPAGGPAQAEPAAGRTLQ